jgi:hypothetical protein
MSKEFELINLLQRRTLAGQTTWEPTAKEYEFLTVVADGISVLIAETPPRDFGEQGPDYVMTVKDKNDTEIFSIRNGLEDVKYNDLAGLYETARRAALNIEKTLDDLLKSLREEG